MKVRKCMSRDKYAAERRRQRRHDFELGCEKFAEMVNTKRDKTKLEMMQQLPPGIVNKLSIEDDSIMYPLQTQTDKKADLK